MIRADIQSVELLVTKRSEHAPLWEAIEAARKTLQINGLENKSGAWRISNATSPSGNKWVLTFGFYTLVPELD